MTELPPDRFGLADEQEIEVEEWTDDLGFRHEIVEDDPRHHDTLDERLRREAPERLRGPRPKHRLTQPDEGLGPDLDDEEIATLYVGDTDDVSPEERALRIDSEDDLS